jgi:glutamine phosphoribosylpyrophosphate amidotransferase
MEDKIVLLLDWNGILVQNAESRREVLNNAMIFKNSKDAMLYITEMTKNEDKEYFNYDIIIKSINDGYNNET